MFSEFFRFFSHYRPIFNIVTRFNASGLGDYLGVNELKREVPIVVSLSSSETNFDDLELTLYSIFNQSVLPDRVILWLSDFYDLTEVPYSITRYIKNGLEIRFVDNKKSFTKIIYALKELQNSIIITADDSILYPRDWLKKLYHSYISSPKDIHVHMAYKIVTNHSKISSCREWTEYAKDETASFQYFPECSCGVLYPPNCFVRDVFREDIYDKKVNASWDVWSWIMAIVSNRKIRLVKNHISLFGCTNIFKKFFSEHYKIKHYDRKDYQLIQLMEYYGQNISKKIF